VNTKWPQDDYGDHKDQHVTDQEKDLKYIMKKTSHSCILYENPKRVFNSVSVGNYWFLN
jgi:hypothetical protein